MAIELARGKSADLEWTLSVEDKKLTVSATVTGTTSVVAEATLEAPLVIPPILIAGQRLKTRAEIEAEGTQAIKEARAELIRRYPRLDLEWSVAGQAFFGLKKNFDGAASAALIGHARLYLAQWLGPETQNDDAAIAELVLFGSFDAELNLDGTAKACKTAVGVIVVLRRNDIPRLRIDLDDLNIGLPEFKLPKLNLPDLPALDWPGVSVGAIARAFERLLQATGITVDVKPSNAETPELRLTDLTTAPKWAIVQKSDGKPQPFDVIVKSGGNEIFRIEKLTAVYDGKLKIAGTLTIQQKAKFSGGHDLGPLLLTWTDVEVTAVFRAPVTGGTGPYLSADVTFAALTLSARDDPEAQLTLAGQLRLTPNDIEVVKLDVKVGADTKTLLKIAKKIADGVFRIVSSCDPGDATVPPFLEKLLDVLARLASAAARAAGFVGRLVGDLLAGIARAVGTLIEALAKLLREAGKNLIIEIRFRVDPFEVVQIVVTARSDAARTTPAKIAGLGLELSIPVSWQPALLIDFVAQPGVYLLALPDQTTGDVLAELSTDLWLRREASVGPVRDADPLKGERTNPLLALSIRKRGNPRAIVIAGVRDRKPVFLQKIGDARVELDFGGGIKFAVCPERPVMTPLQPADIDVEIDAAQVKDRVLALLGLGDTGDDSSSGTPKFLQNLKQVIWIKEIDKAVDFKERTVTIKATLGLRVGGAETELKIGLALSLDDLSVSITGSDALDIKSKPIDREGLGLRWLVTPNHLDANGEGPVFRIAFDESTTALALHPDATMKLRYADLSSDGRGLELSVTMFRAGRGGLDIDATVSDQSVRLNGLDVPFRFTAGSLRIRNGQLIEGTVAGKGKLPPDLVGDAGVSISLTFTQRDGRIELQSGSAQLDKSGEPIVCHATRFTLTISHLGLDFVRENGQVHFYFVVTGTLLFTPKPGEFASGLLKFLKDARINLEKVPLAGDARVLAKHINFQIALKPKLRINVFELFSFELRGIGFHPSSPKFNGAPALNISGQIAFAEIGDVISPKIDFHGLWIAPPAEGQSLPRIKADGLGVDIGLPGTARLSGTVLAVDERLPTLEGRELAPPEYKTYGFLGEGRLAIEGFATMAASFGFLEIELPTKERKKTFFLFVQQEQIAIEIPTPVWTLYMREVGFGFGYRYTLEGIKAAEEAQSVAELIRTLDDVSKRQGELASFAAWRPDPEKDNVTLALRAAIQFAPASKKFNEKQEAKTANPFLFDIVAALRSDMTFLMAVRGWPFTNYLDFVKDTDGLRTNPFFNGYMYISAPRSEFLARFISNRKGFIGKTPPVYTQLEVALRAVDFSATLYIRPGLLHYELGWPDQLKVTLFEEPNLRAEVRGGMIFRVWDGAMLTGFNIEADAFLRIGGQAGGDSLGVSAEASLTAAFLARFIAYLDFATGKYLFYGVASLDACLVLRISAWLRVDLRFTSFTIRIGFSFSIQLSIALELAVADSGVGARADVRVAISVFGATLSVRVGFTIDGGELAAARARVERFMAMSLTADAPEPQRIEAAKRNDNAVQSRADQAQKAAKAPIPPAVKEKPEQKDFIGYAAMGDPIPATNFWLVLRRIGTRPDSLPNEDLVMATLVPRDGRFFAGGAKIVDHKLAWTNKVTLFALDPASRKFAKFTDKTELSIQAKTDSSLPEEKKVTLRSMLDACFLIDGRMVEDGNDVKLEVTKYNEPRGKREFSTVQRIAGDDPRERGVKRGDKQKEFRAETAREGEIVTAVRDARTTLLSHFLEQFTVLADSSVIADGIHIADYGLVFAMKPDSVATFIDGLEVTKSDSADQGKVALLNPIDRWFENSHPQLNGSRHDVTVEGIKLDWDLDPIWKEEAVTDPEHFLHHYEIERVVEGRENVRRTFHVKPVATPGEGGEGKPIALFKPDWQFSDDLSDLPEQLRKALLPRGGADAAPAAAAAWIAAFGDKEEVTVTYVVTPVDIAGSHGLSATLYADIRRPAVPVRAATAQLVVIAPREPLENPRALDDVSTPPGLHAFLGISDPHWDDLGPEVTSEQQVLANLPWLQDRKVGDHLLRRSYRLVLDPDDIVPSGVFGPGGLTARLRTPAATDEILPTADEEPFPFARERANQPPWVIERKDPLPETLSVAKPERRQFPFWIDLTKFDPNFANVLWSRRDQKQHRVAIRAYLDTILEVLDGTKVRATMTSRRVPVDIELRVPKGKTNALMLRPAVFEWPVRVDYPPLAPNRVRTRAGLARFRGALPKNEIGGSIDIQPYLDPSRRTLTEVAWTAAAEVGPKQLVGGYDVFELDLDELAPFDTSGGPLQNDEKAWKRARRLARVQLLPRSAAMLTPSTIDDPTAWQAHMPSEVWRCNRSGDTTKRRGSLPLRKGWYSPRESWIQWPANVPRRVLLPRVEEEWITHLLANGSPDFLKVALKSGATEQPPISVDPRKARGDDKQLFDLSAELDHSTAGTIKAVGGKPMPAPLVRRALQCLASSSGIERSSLVLEITATVQSKRVTIEVDPQTGASREVVENADLSSTQSIPLPPDGDLHPVLAETLDLLAWTKNADNVVYRRFEVVTEPSPPLRAKDVSSFFSATDPEKDPYGWMALGALGLATTVKLHDNDLGEFVQPEELLHRIGLVFPAVLERYAGVGGAPMVDVFLRPGNDRLSGDVDDTAPAKPETLQANADALAFAQLSLRPAPLQSFRYAFVVIPFDKSPVLVEKPADFKGDVTIHRLADGSVISLTNDLSKQKIEGFGGGREPLIELLIRYPQSDDVMKVFPGLTGVVPQLFADPEDADVFDRLDTVYEHGAFAELDAAAFAELPERAAMDVLLVRMAQIPEVVVPVTVEQRRDLVTPYLGWMRRFLDHGLAPKQKTGYSICAPVRQQPWKLAATADGSVSLNFLHEDRFAHARAYAVRPFGRYHEQAVAMQGESQRAAMEQIAPESTTPPVIGHAIAVSPRTARLETPAIVASRTSAEDWQLVVARHPEQDLAMSNRTLFARLAFEGTAVSWVQDYPDKAWPQRLEPMVQLSPDYALKPVQRRPVAKDLDDAPRFIDIDLANAAADDPTIWKGAEIYRVAHLPHHLRVTALAAARAGIVVSGISYATQVDFQFELPAKLETRRVLVAGNVETKPIAAPKWSLEKRDGKVVLCFRISALSYGDLMPKKTFETWIAEGRDVAHWPDAGVIYVLTRRSIDADKKTVLEDEAEVLTVAPGQDAAPKTFALRARGPSWTPGGPVQVKNTSSAATPQFELTACVRRVSTAFRPRGFSDPANPADWQKFIDKIGALVKLTPVTRGGGAMTLVELPEDSVIDQLAELTDDASKKLIAIFRSLVRDAVLDGAVRWVLRAEKGTQAESRDVDSRWRD